MSQKDQVETSGQEIYEDSEKETFDELYSSHDIE